MGKKWTPGPWEWDGKVWDYDKENEAPWLVGVDDGPIVLCGGIECTSEANAHLIAAAPELYESLEKAIDYHKKRNLGWHSDELVVSMEAALAKARGETGERGE